jgi:hypothetical protein
MLDGSSSGGGGVDVDVGFAPDHIDDNLEESEVYELDAHYIDDDIVDYLKDIRHGYGTDPKFTHNGIAVYYVGESDEVWVENMDAEEEE